MTTRVLCIDPGGMRGIATVRFLVDLEKKLGKPLYDCFDVFCGTSIGALIATYLAFGGKVSELDSLISGNELPGIIFSKTSVNKAFGWIPKLGRLLPQYLGGPKKRECNRLWEGKRMSHCEKGLLIGTYDITSRSPVFWNNLGCFPYDPFVADVVDASSAAPTFFPLVQINFGIQMDNKGMEYYTDIIHMKVPRSGNYHVDGGVANHFPGLVTYGILKKMNPSQKIKLLSVGTGYQNSPIDHSTRGVISWILGGLIDVLQDGPVQTMGTAADLILGNDFYRVNSRLPEGTSDAIDNISYRNRYMLGKLGELNTRQKLLNSFVTLRLFNKVPSILHVQKEIVFIHNTFQDSDWQNNLLNYFHDKLVGQVITSFVDIIKCNSLKFFTRLFHIHPTVLYIYTLKSFKD
jgi:patatin-like phospholipase/acyl hydrolase